MYILLGNIYFKQKHLPAIYKWKSATFIIYLLSSNFHFVLGVI